MRRAALVTLVLVCACQAPQTSSPPVDPVPVLAFDRFTLEDSRACALDTADRLWCWDLAEVSGPTPVSPRFIDAIPSARSLVVVRDSVCVVSTEGALWYGADDGSRRDGESLECPEPPSPRTDCQIEDDGVIRCPDFDDYGSIDSPAAPELRSDHGWQSLVSSYRHACALDGVGQLWCWARTRSEHMSMPVWAEDLKNPTLVAAGANHTCALDGVRTIACWGADEALQLGARDYVSASTRATRFDLPKPVVQLVAASDTTCAKLADDTLWCWGPTGQAECEARPSGMGQMVTCGGPRRTPPVEIATNVTSAFAGLDGVCFSSEGKPLARVPLPTLWTGEPPEVAAGTASSLCGGVSMLGAADIGASQDLGLLVVPKFPSGLHDSDTNRLVCHLDEHQRFTCQSESNGVTAEPYQLSLRDVRLAAAGRGHVCAVAGDGLWCWGANSDGRVTYPASQVVPLPTRVRLGSNPDGWTVQALALGGNHTCVITTESGLLCWGSNAAGQITAAGLPPRPAAVRVVLPGT